MNVKYVEFCTFSICIMADILHCNRIKQEEKSDFLIKLETIDYGRF